MSTPAERSIQRRAARTRQEYHQDRQDSHQRRKRKRRCRRVWRWNRRHDCGAPLCSDSGFYACEHCKVFACRCCGLDVSWDAGASLSDGLNGWCNDCWYDAQPAGTGLEP